MPNANNLSVWLLTDGTPGHLSQSRGVVDAVARFRPVAVTEVCLEVRVRWLKSLLRYALPLSPSLSRRLLPLAYQITIPADAPDLLVSSGGNTLLASALLASVFRVPNVYSGTRKGYPPEAYARVYSVTPQGGVNNVVLPLPPVPGALLQALPAPNDNAPLCLLIGGPGAGYDYQNADWLALSNGINALAQQTGRRWCISTSRRTGTAVELLLKQQLDANSVDEIVYYGPSPRPTVREFLARAAAVFVSEDSLTMVAEAIHSGRPTFSLQPANFAPDQNDEQALQGYVAKGFLQRVACSKLASLNLAAVRQRSPLPDVQSLIYQDLAALLPEVCP